MSEIGLVLSTLGEFKSAGEIRYRASPGHVLEVNMPNERYFALYLGDGKIMYLEPGDQNTGVITEELLENISWKVRIVETLSGEAANRFHIEPLPLEEALQRAQKWKGATVGLPPDRRDGAYYCTLWRFGRGFQLQTNNLPDDPTYNFLVEVGRSGLQWLLGVPAMCVLTWWYNRGRR